MKSFLKNIVLALAIISALTACQMEETSPLTSSINSDDSNSYIVVLNSESEITLQGVGNYAETQVKNLLNNHKISLNNVTAYYDNIFTGCAVKLTSSQLAELKSDKSVKLIEEDRYSRIDDKVEPFTGKEEKLLGQITPWGITSVGNSVDATSNTGVAWIVDTGINMNHLDLNVDASRSRTFVTSGADALSPEDLNGHGSHVSGIIAAKNNADGVVGVCAGATVIAVKCMNQYGSGLLSSVLSGLNYVAGNLISGKVNVVNMSITFSASTTLDNAVKAVADKGAYICVAAGNSAKDCATVSPARVNYTNIFTVSSYSQDTTLSTFSNYGLAVDYAAPGNQIYSTYKNGGYATLSGTSMATPHLAGIILANNGTIKYNGTILNDKDSVADKKSSRP